MRVITVTQSGSGVTGGRRTQVIVSRTGPQGPAGGGAGSVALDDLTDVSLVGTTSGDFLRYNGTAWTDTKIVASDLGTGTADIYHFLAGDLTWQDAVPLDVSAKNTTASTIPKGTPVYITGSVGSGHTVEVAPANSANSATMASIGLTVTELTANATGYVRTMGVLEGLSTGAYTVNQTLFVASGGGLTNVRPSGTTTLVQNIGRVMRANNNNGTVLILGPGRVNDVPNRIGTTYLADGTAGASNYLRGDQTWSTISAADVGAAPTSRNLTASTGLSGGGDLSADRSFSVLYGTTAGTAAQGNDTRLSDARTPLAHKTSHQSGGSDELALAGAQITSGTVAVARLATQAPPTPTPYASNDWVPLWTGLGGAAASTTVGGTPTSSNNAVRYQPVWIGQTASLIGLGIDVSAANAGASAVVRLGLYSDSSGRPGTVLVDAGTASLNTAVAKELTFSSVSLSPGWYWLALATQSLDTAGTNPTFRGLQNSASLATRTSVPSATTAQDAVFVSSSVTGAFGNSPTVTVGTTAIGFKLWGKFA